MYKVKAAEMYIRTKKIVRLMLMKLTTGVDFTNILQAAFVLKDPNKTKRHC